MSATILLKRTLLCIGLTIAAAASCPAQAGADEPEKLTQMRKIYEAEVVKRKLPILKKLAKDLGALEKKLTKANKLEEALKARKERGEIEATIQSLGASVASSGKTTTPGGKPEADRKEFSIPMSSANLQGRLKRPGSGSYITSWVTTTCVATWSGGNVVPGLYDVYIDFDTDWRYGGGELKFEELGQDFHCVIKRGSERKTMKVGTFKLGTKLGFSIRCLSKNRHGVLRLYGVTFKPADQ